LDAREAGVDRIALQRIDQNPRGVDDRADVHGLAGPQMTHLDDEVAGVTVVVQVGAAARTARRHGTALLALIG
jgi:hypothetical protein